MRIRPRLSGALIGIAASTLVASPAVAIPAVARSAAPPPMFRLRTVPSGYDGLDPQVLRTRDGVTLAAWTENGHTPNHLRVSRKVGANAWRLVAVPQGGLVQLDEPYLIEDVVNDRVIMAAHGDTKVPGGLGTYVWRSANNGRTWTAPRMVWDNLGTGNLTPDGNGGFFAISDSTGVSVIHVPAALTKQTWPKNDVVLSDRIASRGAIDLATIGSHNKLLFAFADNQNQAWVHVTAAAGKDKDVRLMRGLYADGRLKIAADRVGGVAVAIRQVHTTSGNVNRLYAIAFQISGNTLVLRKMRLVSGLKENVVDFGVTTLKTPTGGASGRFRIAWLNDAAALRVRQSSRPSDPIWGTSRALATFPARGYAYPAVPALDGSWLAMRARTSSTSRQVEIAIPLG